MILIKCENVSKYYQRQKEIEIYILVKVNDWINYNIVSFVIVVPQHNIKIIKSVPSFFVNGHNRKNRFIDFNSANSVLNKM